jgi:hypothetical protein
MSYVVNWRDRSTYLPQGSKVPAKQTGSSIEVCFLPRNRALACGRVSGWAAAM